MKLLVFLSLGLLIAFMLFCWAITFIEYHLTSRHFKITLFGICLRRIALEDIQAVSKKHSSRWAEHWWNTLHPDHRMLVIKRRRGLFRNIIITPKNRYVLKTELERAIGKPSSAAPEIDPDEETSAESTGSTA